MRSYLACPAVALPLATGCARQAWLTPVGAFRLPRASSCPVAVEAAPEPGTRMIAVVHCSDGLFGAGETCWQLLHEKACAAGADVIYGAHYEGDDLVASIGTVAAESYSGRQMAATVPAETPR